MDSFFLPKLINDLVEFNPYSIGIFDIEGRLVMSNQAMYIPVSYTHLDVYKRQLFAASIRALFSKLSFFSIIGL